MINDTSKYFFKNGRIIAGYSGDEIFMSWYKFGMELQDRTDLNQLQKKILCMVQEHYERCLETNDYNG